jgi:hypothetical protein
MEQRRSARIKAIPDRLRHPHHVFEVIADELDPIHERCWLAGNCGAQRRDDMAQTVADQFAEILVAAGVKRIYGIVGDSLNGLTDALRRQGKIDWVNVRHEEVAAFAAGAEAHLTGELAVCAGSCR